MVFLIYTELSELATALFQHMQITPFQAGPIAQYVSSNSQFSSPHTGTFLESLGLECHVATTVNQAIQQQADEAANILICIS